MSEKFLFTAVILFKICQLGSHGHKLSRQGNKIGINKITMRDYSSILVILESVISQNENTLPYSIAILRLM